MISAPPSADFITVVRAPGRDAAVARQVVVAPNVLHDAIEHELLVAGLVHRRERRSPYCDSFVVVLDELRRTNPRCDRQHEDALAQRDQWLDDVDDPAGFIPNSQHCENCHRIDFMNRRDFFRSLGVAVTTLAALNPFPEPNKLPLPIPTVNPPISSAAQLWVGDGRNSGTLLSGSEGGIHKWPSGEIRRPVISAIGSAGIYPLKLEPQGPLTHLSRRCVHKSHRSPIPHRGTVRDV